MKATENFTLLTTLITQANFIRDSFKEMEGPILQTAIITMANGRLGNLMVMEITNQQQGLNMRDCGIKARNMGKEGKCSPTVLYFRETMLLTKEQPEGFISVMGKVMSEA